MIEEGGEDLAAVVGEIVDLMRARGATLTLYHDYRTPVLLFESPSLAAGSYHPLLAASYETASQIRDGQLAWQAAPDGSPCQAAIIPVQRVPGHARLAITVVFDRTDTAIRGPIETLYRERRPFAVGYFRLWQSNRLNLRRTKALEAALDCTDVGVILVDNGAHVIFANEAATELLDASDGLSNHNGQLRATHIGDGINLQAALSHIGIGRAAADRTMHAPLLAFRRKSGPPLVATILPTRAEAMEPREVAATVYIVDPAIDTTKKLSALCRLYGLSPVETTLVCHLARGDTIADAAQKMHIREQTARGYTKQIFVKTGTNRQTELVAMMLSSLVRTKDHVLQEALTSYQAEQALSRFVELDLR